MGFDVGASRGIERAALSNLARQLRLAARIGDGGGSRGRLDGLQDSVTETRHSTAPPSATHQRAGARGHGVGPRR